MLDDPLLEHIGACWKFAKIEPLHIAEVFSGVVDDLANYFYRGGRRLQVL